MRHTAYLLACLLPLLAGCASKHVIEVENTSTLDRNEIVSVELSQLQSVCGEEPVRLLAADGKEIPYQLTYDGKMIFPVEVKASGKTSVTVEPGNPAPADTLACGAFYPERKDDLAWENDRAAYRAYGPALQADGEHAYGYDIWTKSVTRPVVAKRYYEALNLDKSLHKDFGDGMDTYTVGPTLGGGTAALLDSLGNIVYPWCFSYYEILDNGPLRFTARLTYDSGETRLISLDAGEFLNRTAVRFDSCDAPSIAPGIVVHQRNADGYTLVPDECYMAYADPTDNPSGENGLIYVGVVAPQADSMYYRPFDEPQFGESVGHILAKSAYTPGSDYVYYWGSGWDKGFMPDRETWLKYLSDFNTRLRNPLTITIK